MPRLYCPVSLVAGQQLELPAAAARHAQVLRVQPGSEVTLFNGQGGEFPAAVDRMGRSSVSVRVGQHDQVERECARQLHLAIGMPANERMDWLVEKATELGVASIQPLVTERSVLRLDSQRGEKKQAHWQAITIAACEQCGRNRLPAVSPPMPLVHWLGAIREPAQGVLLTLRAGARPLPEWAHDHAPLWFLSGPEGGLSPTEEDAALAAGFLPTSLGPRVLRAETAALVALARLQP